MPLSVRARTGLLAVLFVGAVVVLGSVAIALVVAGNRDGKDDTRPGQGPGPAAGKPSADREGQSWTNRELFDYLRSHGLNESFAWEPSGLGIGEVTSITVVTTQPEGPDTRRNELCFIERHEREESARLKAGSDRHARQWGRFVVKVIDNPNPVATAKLRAVLRDALGL